MRSLGHDVGMNEKFEGEREEKREGERERERERERDERMMVEDR